MSSTAEAIGAPVLALGRRLVQLTSATRAPLGLSKHANGEGKEAEALFAELLKEDPKGIDRLVQHHAHEASGQEKGEKVEYLQKLLQAVIEHKPALQPRVTEALVLAMNEGAEIHEKSNAISYFSMKLDCLPGVDAVREAVRCILDTPGGVCRGRSGQVVRTTSLYFLPNLLHLVSVHEQQDASMGNITEGLPFREQQVGRICEASWPAECAVNILKTLRDIDVSEDSLCTICRKAVKQFEEAEPGDMPTLMYHMLLAVSTKGTLRTKQIILDGLVDHIEDLEKKMLESERDQCETVPSLLDSQALHSLQGTMLQHFSYTMKQDHQLAICFVSGFTKGNRRFSLFSVALLLSIADSTAWAGKLVKILKSAIIEFYAEKRRVSGSEWLTSLELKPANRLPELILEVVEHSRLGWEVIAQSLCVLGEELVKCGRSAAAQTSQGDAPTVQAVQLGLDVLAGTFKYHGNARRTILSKVATAVMTKSAELRHDLSLLRKLTHESLSEVLQELPVIREAMDHLAALDCGEACAFLSAIHPLLLARPDLRDHGILVLRKAVFNRQENSRCIAVAGFVQLLSASTTTSSGQASSSSESIDTRLFEDSMGFLRRSLGQQPGVRRTLYERLPALFDSHEALRIPVLELILPCFERICGRQDATGGGMPFELEHGASQGLEPFDELLCCIQRLAISARDDTGEVVEEITRAREIVQQLLKAMLVATPNSFGLDNKDQEYDDGDTGTVRKAQVIVRVFERLVEYLVLSTADEVDQDVAVQVTKLFQRRDDFLMLSSTGSTAKVKGKSTQPAKGKGKGKAKAGKDAASIEPVKKMDCQHVDLSTECILRLFRWLDTSPAEDSADDAEPRANEQCATAILTKADHTMRFTLECTERKLVSMLRDSKKRADGADVDHETRCKWCVQIAPLLLRQFDRLRETAKSTENAEGKGKARKAAPKAQLHVTALRCLDLTLQTVIANGSDDIEQTAQRLAASVKRRESASSSETGTLRASDKVHARLRDLQQLSVQLLRSEEWHAAVIMVGILRLLLSCLPPSEQRAHGSWVMGVCRKHKAGSVALCRTLMSLLLELNRTPENLDVTHELGRAIRSVFKRGEGRDGDDDDDDNDEMDDDDDEGSTAVSYSCLNAKTVTAAADIYLAELVRAIQDVDYLAKVVHLMARNAPATGEDREEHHEAQPNVLRMTRLQNMSLRMRSVVLAITPVINVSCPERITMQLVRFNSTIFKTAANLIKEYSRTEEGTMPPQLEKLLCVLKELSANIYTLLHVLQSERPEEESEKKGKKSALEKAEKARSKRRSKSIPTLIFNMEQFDLHLNKLSQKWKKVTIKQWNFRSTARDFRIDKEKVNARLLEVGNQENKKRKKSGASQATQTQKRSRGSATQTQDEVMDEAGEDEDDDEEEDDEDEDEDEDDEDE